ncbi:hypothetical protein MtrunA17_Chr2g0294551 [Medicago truncatula]|uniref:Transmembrane protein n=1 Tax=Medicago truncatula TaxID=3880 RepID=A0A396J714_MEDTR|nr:hypothetical protein MtrunA17_Chr2g0294551 [Medicago truncatula]
MLQMQESHFCVVNLLVHLNPKTILGIVPFVVETIILWSIAISSMIFLMQINLLLLQMLLLLSMLWILIPLVKELLLLLKLV